MTEQNKRDASRFAPIAAIASTLLFIGAGFFARAPIVDGVSHRGVPVASLRTPLWYAALAPMSNLFDGLTMLSVSQLIATFGFAFLVAIALRVGASASRARRTLDPYRARDHLRFAASVVGGVVAVAGLALLLPRSMAGLRVSDSDLVTIDFHSHTSASHDGRPEFTPQANRAWHSLAGFDVAYISDHHTFTGALAAMQANPPTAGDGTVLLPALEYRDDDEHVIALGLDPAKTNPGLREWHPIYRDGDAGPRTAAPPLLILCLPGDVTRFPPDEEIGIARLSAIEISDGSPKGIEQTARDAATIVSAGGRLHLSLVSGSDNHGWGRTAIAWTLMRIPNWRAMTPVELDDAIRKKLLDGPPGAVQVVSRRLPPASSAMAIAFTAPELGWEILRDIGWTERIAWLGWMWSGWGILLLARRRRTSRRLHIEWPLPELDGGIAVRSLQE